MKSELRENMYVRTKDGRMGKLMGYMAFNENKIAIWTNTTEEGIKITPVVDKDTIVKANYNIIDILEVGDYVNGYKVIDIVENDIYISDYYAESYIGIVKAKDIKTIVTKEQFEQMVYKVGE